MASKAENAAASGPTGEVVLTYHEDRLAALASRLLAGSGHSVHAINVPDIMQAVRLAGAIVAEVQRQTRKAVADAD